MRLTSFQLRSIQRSEIDFLLKPLAVDMTTGVLRQRTREELIELLPSLQIFWDQGKLVGMVALTKYDWCSELSLLWVAPNYRQLGLGRELVAQAFFTAQELAENLIFICTVSPTKVNWFKALGFHEASASAVPDKKWQNYPANRQPIVMLQEVSHYLKQFCCCRECAGRGWEFADRWDKVDCPLCCGTGYENELLKK
ncbi:MAG: GNAT family N-acetyltransferase [Candidatus Buchananbacteria bacterium]